MSQDRYFKCARRQLVRRAAPSARNLRLHWTLELMFVANSFASEVQPGPRPCQFSILPSANPGQIGRRFSKMAKAIQNRRVVRHSPDTMSKFLGANTIPSAKYGPVEFECFAAAAVNDLIGNARFRISPAQGRHFAFASTAAPSQLRRPVRFAPGP